MSLSRSASVLSRPSCPPKREAPSLNDFEDRRRQENLRQPRWQGRKADSPQCCVRAPFAGLAHPAGRRTANFLSVALFKKADAEKPELPRSPRERPHLPQSGARVSRTQPSPQSGGQRNLAIFLRTREGCHNLLPVPCVQPWRRVERCRRRCRCRVILSRPLLKPPTSRALTE